MDAPKNTQRRAATVLGWLTGGIAGLLLNYGVFQAYGTGYPVVPTSFGLFVLGCFAGMWTADRLGDRGIKVLAVTTGLALTLALVLLVARLMLAN
jgi:hypothetical protein